MPGVRDGSCKGEDVKFLVGSAFELGNRWGGVGVSPAFSSEESTGEMPMPPFLAGSAASVRINSWHGLPARVESVELELPLKAVPFFVLILEHGLEARATNKFSGYVKRWIETLYGFTRRRAGGRFWCPSAIGGRLVR